MIYGAIEAGGTKIVCGVGTDPQDVSDIVRFETTEPEEDLRRIGEYFEGRAMEALGAAWFGPLDLNPASSAFGCVGHTPKPGWSDFPIKRRLEEVVGARVILDTDVNAAALGEAVWGAGRGCDPLLYVTVGTGIGGGVVVRGETLKGVIHPEMGHIRIPHDTDADPFGGVCPYHADCMEGLSSGPSIEKRWGIPGERLPRDHEAWDLEAQYLALGFSSFVLTLSPARVIFGGGLSHHGQLVDGLRRHFVRVLNGYIHNPLIERDVDEYIVTPGLGDLSGISGALAMARGLRPTNGSS